MNKLNWSQIVRSARMTIVKHSPEILTGLGITGMIGATVLAVRATPKALILIDEKKKEKEVDKLTPAETFKTTWKCYIPAAVTTVVSAACLIGASSVNLKRNAALATAYTLSESALKEYQDKVVETIGEKKERAIREDIAKDKLEQHPVSKTEVFMTGGGETLFYDPTSDRYFKSDLEKVRRIINDLNESMINGCEFYISLNEFYSELGLRYTMVGDELGWNVSKWGQIKIDFAAQVAENGQPCLVLDYRNPPKRDFASIK